MSDARALSAVTATLRHLLTAPVQALISGLNDLSVTTQPLDLARKGELKPAQINIFLYQTVISAAWRSMDMPRQVRPGESAQPPLALNLHYLVTAYGRSDNDNEDSAAGHLIIGGAMSVLHDHPLLGRQEIRDALGGSNLADQFERIRITPLPLSLDELSKLWSSFQTPYRFSAAYECAVVLIDSNRGGSAALPVLRRGEQDRGVSAVTGAGPSLREVVPPLHQPAARLGEQLLLLGEGLQAQDTMLRFSSLIPPLPEPPPPLPKPLPPPLVELAPLPPEAGAQDQVRLLLPDLADDADALERWAPGSYTVTAISRPLGSPALQSKTAVAFALAPTVTLSPNSTTVATVNPGDVLTLTCRPRVRANQRVLVIFGDRQLEYASLVNPDPLSPTYQQTPTTITVKVPVVKKGLYLVRLRVDGIDSVPAILAGTPALPVFDPEQQVAV
ncbi:DUF4255 domain-containing protein [Janthinobacterium fluminis]|uniref:DUF4255 domain-containing protein n=1 Tax=Janthinobacterium fluminis TaxID=2987524 RepID=A0ABT5JW91_9BURK|nr:DUF4255 domain-containing protein [Janthinobacterium fluminis]MDC8757014.1 DUF4255 domain-containing protein [Janthinobacterium fluminis]